jgi:hypothetical protein
VKEFGCIASFIILPWTSYRSSIKSIIDTIKGHNTDCVIFRGKETKYCVVQHNVHWHIILFYISQYFHKPFEIVSSKICFYSNIVGYLLTLRVAPLSSLSRIGCQLENVSKWDRLAITEIVLEINVNPVAADSGCYRDDIDL